MPPFLRPHFGRHPVPAWLLLLPLALPACATQPPVHPQTAPAASAPAAQAIPIRRSTPLPGGRGLGTTGYAPLPDEQPFIGRITEKEINLWPDVKLPRPDNVSDADWARIQQELAQAEKKQIPARQYGLAGQQGRFVGWFGIVRTMTYDAPAQQTRLLIEHKYFDGLTDLHIHVVSLYGAGDFEVLLPGRVDAATIPPLALICAYGTVSVGEKLPYFKAEYVRVWDWGLFTFMDYGVDKSNPLWIKLRKVKGEDAYSPHPTPEFYVERLGPRETVAPERPAP